MVHLPAAGAPLRSRCHDAKGARRAAGSVKARSLKVQRRGLFKPMMLSRDLAAIVRAKKMSWTEIVRSVWGYIKRKNLTDGSSFKLVVPDSLLAKVCPKASFGPFELAPMLRLHVLPDAVEG